MLKEKYRDKVILKKRMLLILGILFLLFFLLTGRLGYLMIYDSKRLSSIAKAQWTTDVTLSAKRGRILDRNGSELAVSADVYRVDVDMHALVTTLSKKKMSKEELANKLSPILSMQSQDVLKKLNTTLPNGAPIASVNIKRKVDKETADKIKNLKINGLLISSDTERFYPQGDLAAQLIGHTNSDGIGLTGVELSYNKVLKGKDGKRIVEMDSSRTEDIPDTISEYTSPQDGKDVVLTIDKMIQLFCEKAAKQALIDNKAKDVRIVAMDPKTGEILAMVNEPSYDLNNPWTPGLTTDQLNQEWRNEDVSDTFEPGSIFKVVTAVTAMEKGVVKDSDTFVCNGSKTIGSTTIHCWKTTGHGTQSFLQILENSCNVGFMDVGEKLGANNLCEYINKLGFGQLTGIDLPGEAKGIIKPANKISPTDLATISFGQTDTVSAVQYLAAFNAVANGGTWIRPHVMKYIGHYDENKGQEITDSQYNNFGKKTVLDSNITATLRGYLEKVVSEGGGQNAFIEGYHIAGKTGTAKKAGPNGRYMDNKYEASFAGMAPASDPRITLLVTIDEPDPSNYYAGQIAAPVAKQIFYDIFNYWSLKPDASGEEVAKSLLKDIVIPDIRGMKKDDAIKLLKQYGLQYNLEGSGDYISDVNPVPGYTVKEDTKINVTLGGSGTVSNILIMPNFKGYTREKANTLLNDLGLKAVFSGSGIILDQSIAAGQQVTKGATVTFELDPLGD